MACRPPLRNVADDHIYVKAQPTSRVARTLPARCGDDSLGTPNRTRSHGADFEGVPVSRPAGLAETWVNARCGTASTPSRRLPTAPRSEVSRPRRPRLQNELDELLAHLRAAVGLGGRSRRFDDATERARTSVQKAIRRAIGAIGRDCPRSRCPSSIHQDGLPMPIRPPSPVRRSSGTSEPTDTDRDAS